MSKEQPKVSIIVPVYKVEKYLRRCLDSILSQTFDDFEVICVNDGSPDNSIDILNEYASRDNRFCVVEQENQGLSMARNNGKKLARGEYIYFLDSDDYIHPQLLEVSYYLAQKYDADLVNFECYNEKKEKFETPVIDITKVEAKITTAPLFLGYHHEKNRIHINTWTKLYKKGILDGIEFIPHIQFEDYPHLFEVLKRHPKTVITQEKLYYYVNNDGSISNADGNPKQIKDYSVGLNYVYELYKAPQFKKELNFIKQKFIPIALRQQLARCKNASAEQKPMMFEEFAKELVDLDNKGLISWRGHKLNRYLTYRKLIRQKKSGKDISIKV